MTPHGCKRKIPKTSNFIAKKIRHKASYAEKIHSLRLYVFDEAGSVFGNRHAVIHAQIVKMIS